MGKTLILCEKPAVARDFAKVLNVTGGNKDGYIENNNLVITWCVGHLVTMSYPEKYKKEYKKWNIKQLPIIPDKYKYEVIPSVKKQFDIVKSLFEREDIDRIFFGGDSAREGEYIGRLVLAQCSKTKTKGKDLRRIWIDSQTEEEIMRGLKEAKPLSAYDNLAASAYCRAKEDWLMGMNFSRALSCNYGYDMNQVLGTNKYVSIAVGRVMTCVLGMIVERELAIKNFIETPFYGIKANISEDIDFTWKAEKGTPFFESPFLYNEKGFKKKEAAQSLINELQKEECGELLSIEKKKKVKNAPLLYNLAELQNDCSKMLKVSPDETLALTQSLYEKKLVTYPRTDARVLSSSIAKEIGKNITGIAKIYPEVSEYVNQILEEGTYKNIAATKRYVDDSKISDHYAIIPTGQGYENYAGLKKEEKIVYALIVRRFLSIFLPPAIYIETSATLGVKTEKGTEHFNFSSKSLSEKGYLVLYPNTIKEENENINTFSSELKKGQVIKISSYELTEGKTSPPKRYNSGSMILAMENAGNLIEDEELRSQIKGAGIGTSATRAEVLKKLVEKNYLSLNKKTQILTPTKTGYAVYAIVKEVIPQMLSPKLTASWEKGLSMVEKGEITEEEYMKKLETFVKNIITSVQQNKNRYDVKHKVENIVK